MVGLFRSAWYAQRLDWAVRDAELIASARLVDEKPARGFGKCCQPLDKAHPDWNLSCIYRLYCSMELYVCRAVRRWLPKCERVPLYEAVA
jgi:putative transposase